MTQEAREELLRKIERYDYSTFDTMAEAVRYGHTIGLEIHAWISINEDDHGWGLRSRFSRKNPGTVWRKRDGTDYRSQHSFAFPEVVRYKLAVIEEILTQYDVDGIFLDWIRTGDVRDNPQNDKEGVADRGYEEPLVKGFFQKYGIDPYSIPNGDEAWVRYRAEPHTDFMRSVKQLVKSARSGIPVSVMVAHPWDYRGLEGKIDGNLRGMLLDVTAWAREGLADEFVAAGYYRDGGTPELAYQSLKEETEGKASVWFYAWVPNTIADFKRDFASAENIGAKQILFWEADYIDGRENKKELQEIMKSHSVTIEH